MCGHVSQHASKELRIDRGAVLEAAGSFALTSVQRLIP